MAAPDWRHRRSACPRLWLRHVRACCLLLAGTTPRHVARVLLTLPLTDVSGDAQKVLRLGKRLAQEYDLDCRGRVEGAVLTLWLARRANTDEEVNE